MKPALIFFYEPHGQAVGSLSYYRLDRRLSIARMQNEAVRIGRKRGYCGASLTHSFYDVPEKPQITF
jgi:hypothetical protein